MTGDLVLTGDLILTGDVRDEAFLILCGSACGDGEDIYEPGEARLSAP